MTLNTANSPSSLLHLPPLSLEAAASAHRRNTVGSPTSAEFKPTTVPPQIPTVIYPHHHHHSLPLAPSQQSPLHLGNSPHFHYRSRSPAHRRPIPPPPPNKPSKPQHQHQQPRQNSRSPERAINQQPYAHTRTAAAWLANGRKNDRQFHPLNLPKPGSGPLNMQHHQHGKRPDRPPPIAGPRPSFGHSPQSMSLPSTPNHHPRHLNGVSRSPSPPTCMLDSPRSAASEPASSTAPYSFKPPPAGCLYETLLVDARRRIPYSFGIDRLNPERPRLDRLPPAMEESLTRDMHAEFERLKPSSESEVRRRKFLDKLARILNEEWPGHDTTVHAFGSTENHLCMEDSDVDVCITTKCREVESTCKLATALAKRGMERIVCVPGAKVPIVKIWDPEFKVACDMNVNSTLALDNTRMIKTYVEIDDRVRPLALIIKHWTKQRVLNNAAIGGTLSSYTWICMILNFLQTREPPVLPSLHMLPHKKKPPNNGVDVSFADDIDALRGWGKDNHETLGELLFGFFKKYGHDMDYETKVLSVREGKLLSKAEKGWQYLQNNRLCVEEPFSTGRNLGNTADDCSMRGIHLEFRRAHMILAEKADLAECCQIFEFPPEEVHHVPPPQAPSRLVTLSRSNSSHRLNRIGGYQSGNQRGGGGGGGGRGYHHNNHHNNHHHNNHHHPHHPHHHPHPHRPHTQSHNQGTNHNQNRRATSGAAAFNQNMMQNHHFGHSPEMFGYLPSAHDQLVALQAQIQAHAHAQAQLVVQAHAQSQLHNQHSNPSQSNGNNNNTNNNNTNTTLDAINPFLSWTYLAHLYGLNMMYPGYALNQSNTNSDTSNGPTSPPHTPAAMADGRQYRGNNNDGNRHGLGRGSRTYGPSSRSRSQPPPLYSANGYGRNPSAVAVASSEDEDFGDHSSNGNPPETPPEEGPDEYVGYYSIGGSLQPDLAIVDPHIIGEEEGEESFLEQKTFVDRQKPFSHENLPPPILGHQSSRTPPVPSKAPAADRHLHMVNGNTPYAGDPSFPFETDGASDPTVSLESLYNDVAPSAVPPSSAGSSSERESESAGSPGSTPLNSPNGHGSQEDPLTPIIEAPSPSDPKPATEAEAPVAVPVPVPAPAPAAVPVPAQATKRPEKPVAMRKNMPKDDPVPPTPAPTHTEKNGQRNGNGRSKINGSKSSPPSQPKNTKKGATDQKPAESKTEWKKSNNTKKRRAQANAKEATAPKELERKGG